MTPEQAAALRAEIDAVSETTRKLFASLDEAALLRRPADGRWSPAENLQHLVLTSNAMLPLAEQALSALERNGTKSARPARLGVLGWLLVKSLEPPARMKTKTTRPFEPIDVQDRATLDARLAAGRLALKALIERAAGLDTMQVKVTSPFNASIKYNLYAAFRIMLSHERRHLWAAEGARAAASV